MCEKLVRLLAMLVLRFSLKTVRPVHVLGFVVAAVNVHVLGVEPFTWG